MTASENSSPRKGKSPIPMLYIPGMGRTGDLGLLGLGQCMRRRKQLTTSTTLSLILAELLIAREVGDPNILRPWSQYSLEKHKNSSEEEKRATGPKSALTGPESKKRKKDDMNYEPQLEEFLQVMQPRSRSKLWANDTLTGPSLEQSRLALNNKLTLADKHEERFDGQDAHPEGIKGERTLSSTKQEEDEPNVVVNDDVVSDIDYFRSRIKKDWSDSESSDNEDNPEDSDHSDFNDDNYGSGSAHNKTSADPSSQESKNDEFLESGRLFVVNLPYTATEEELGDHFSKYGSISEVHIVVDKDTKRSKGFAYVSFALPESAARVLEETNRSIFQGRLLRVMPAEQKNYSDKQEINSSGNNHSKTFKQQRNAEKKASEASGNCRSWNSLFMRQDTVVEHIARKFGVRKGELLSDDPAVKVALTETLVVAETKKSLSSAGVNIASLEQFAAGKTDGVKRSDHVILVKNLTYGSSESELSTIFGRFGSLDKIILPPTKTLALVIFLEPAEARAAFDALRYKRYKDSPLNLELAPANILSQTAIVGDNTVVGGVDVRRAFLEQQGAETTEADVDHDRNESRSIYVKNLNFRTSDEIVKKHFTEHMNGRGEILSVRVKKHQKNGKYISKGYGFIEFDSVDTSLNVCRDLQGTVLDGHALILQLSHVKKDEQLHKTIENDRSSTKLIARNVPFEATKKDLTQLLSPFGQIKSLRLPMAANGKPKGFAFVEYVTKQEAQNALQALANTHFYGRHLVRCYIVTENTVEMASQLLAECLLALQVLERAKEGMSIEELRARTAAQFTGSAKLPKKRKHMTVLDEGNVKFERIID
ncbi:hypothetical protein BUALT_Bualt13G0092700 [Buddleja alternifolia]|uniref:RRM domain-containing protein n=1 Tax=Buddleja alternifolia TaxID=168488 RepID=A0AAV6WK61_9LAMI|nr:hypothetical protein BUALT_Bualt13G0092700 [Buddleja alternifolia]